VVLGLVAALAGGAFSTHRMLAWGVARLADRVVASLPQGTPDVVREDLRRRLDCVVRAARERRVSERRLGEFVRACTDALADKQVTADEEERIATIADAICREAGGAPPR
jgi:predicted polyphosphate/ATP-dependent NAD kinase